MDHDVVLTGPAFRLRPVTTSDAAFMFDLRSSERGRFLHPTKGGVADQVAWIEQYLKRPGDYYFMVERHAGGDPEGMIALYDIHKAGRCAEWGRWILKADSLAATESALLIYQLAFDHLGLESTYCRTMAANTAVVSFHTSCGLETAGTELDDGIPHVRQTMTKTRWAECRERVQRLAARLAR